MAATGSANASLTSSERSSTLLGWRLRKSLPFTSRERGTSSGQTQPIAILICSAASAPIESANLRWTVARIA